MMKDSIDQLLDRFYIEYHNGSFEQAIIILKNILLIEGNGSFWIYSRLSSCYYEIMKYDIALRYAKKAYRLNPNSPLVLWDYAGPLIMLKKEQKAIQLLKRIQNMSDDLTLYGFTDSDITWMQSIKNDSNFLIGKAYYTICEDVQAKYYISKYLYNVDCGLKSIYTKEKAKLLLKKIGK